MNVPEHAVYAPASEGPFRCDHCEHFRAPTTCVQPEIVKLRAGRVEAGACCDYFDKKIRSTKFTADEVRRASSKD